MTSIMLLRCWAKNKCVGLLMIISYCQGGDKTIYLGWALLSNLNLKDSRFNTQRLCLTVAAQFYVLSQQLTRFSVGKELHIIVLQCSGKFVVTYIKCMKNNPFSQVPTCLRKCYSQWCSGTHTILYGVWATVFAAACRPYDPIL